MMMMADNGVGGVVAAMILLVVAVGIALAVTGKEASILHRLL